MALTAAAYQHISQHGLLRLIDASSGPDGPQGTQSFWLVPSNGYINGQRLPHNVAEELKGEKFDTQTVEGVEYFLVPEESTNTPGLLSHYAQRTGVAELQNPPGNGVNRVRETLKDYSAATVAPDAVAKYVEDNDSHEEARAKVSEDLEVKHRAVNPPAVEDDKSAAKPAAPKTADKPAS